MPDELAQHCAMQVLDTIHLIMRSTGPEMRKSTPSEISVQQFRSLMTVGMHKNCSVSHVAEHLGSSISSASKIIDGLTERGLVTRQTHPSDRRKTLLALSPSGEDVLQSVRLAGIGVLADKLSSLSRHEFAIVELTMKLLHSTLVQTPGSECQR